MKRQHIGFKDSVARSWENSLPVLAQALKKANLDDTTEIAIEYRICPTNYRIDVMISGRDSGNTENIVIVELKQWSYVERSNLRNFVFAQTSAIKEDCWHPSYQAANYAGLLENFNAYIQDNHVKLSACSYLHNMKEENRKILGNLDAFPFVTDYPVFLKDDSDLLSEYIRKHIVRPDSNIIYNVDHGDRRPSKKIGEQLASALSGNEFFSYTDIQAKIVSSIINYVEDSRKYGERRTLIIEGGPGTGKSIIAINAMGKLANRKQGNLNVAYFTANAAPRHYYLNQLVSDGLTKEKFREFFKSPVSLKGAKSIAYDCALFDEAHRMYTWKSGVGLEKGVNLIKKAIEVPLVSVFFIDEDQAVTVHDAATKQLIIDTSDEMGSKVYILPKLEAQFRVLGGNQYLDMISSFLGYTKKSEEPGIIKNYDFRIYDSPSKMREDLRALNDKYGKTRMVAGYDYEWQSKNNAESYDIILEDGKFKAKWNLRTDMPIDYSWLFDDESFEQVGCIHTCQGLDMEYCGVIIGKDLRFEDGELVFDQTKIAKSDRSSGIRSCISSLAERLIRNTYKVLLTRGMRGTFVYCEDEKLRDYLRAVFNNYSNSTE